MVLLVITKNSKIFKSLYYPYFYTGVFSNFGHVTCPANFKRADYKQKE